MPYLCLLFSWFCGRQKVRILIFLCYRQYWCFTFTSCVQLYFPANTDFRFRIAYAGKVSLIVIILLVKSLVSSSGKIFRIRENNLWNFSIFLCTPEVFLNISFWERAGFPDHLSNRPACPACFSREVFVLGVFQRKTKNVRVISGSSYRG